MKTHLTEEQFAECAMGEEGKPGVAADVTEHLAECEACRAEVAAFAASVASFNDVSLAWSEAQPAESLRMPARKAASQPVWAVASWALAGCLAVISGVSIETHRRAGHTEVEKPAARQAEDLAAQIERDNKLLLAVAEATSAPAESPLGQYGLAESQPDGAGAHKARNEND